jgi:hypothetical protein
MGYTKVAEFNAINVTRMAYKLLVYDYMSLKNYTISDTSFLAYPVKYCTKPRKALLSQTLKR